MAGAAGPGGGEAAIPNRKLGRFKGEVVCGAWGSERIMLFIGICAVIIPLLPQ